MAESSARGTAAIELAGAEASPLRKIAFRMLVALGLIVFVALVSYAGRDGYVDHTRLVRRLERGRLSDRAQL